MAFLGSKLTAALASEGYEEQGWLTKTYYKGSAFNVKTAQSFQVWTPYHGYFPEQVLSCSNDLGLLFNELLLSLKRANHQNWLLKVRPLYVANYVVTYIYKKKKLTRDESENASRAKKGLPWLTSGPE